MSQPSPASTASSSTHLALIVLIRTTVNAPFRIIYPFLPSIARGLGISLATASGLVTLRLMGRMTAPFLGPLADRYGRRRVMESALLLFAVAGTLLLGNSPIIVAAAAFVLFGIGKGLYDPALHAYLGDRVPYQVRGKVVGIVELSWSMAWLIGVPISGLLIERFGWRVPWGVIAALSLLSIIFTRVSIPTSPHPHAPRLDRSFVASIFKTWGDLLRRQPVVVLLSTSVLITAAIELPFIVYGAWIEETFALSPSVLGGASVVIGLAEATAEVSTSIFSDRLGKRRSVLAGLLGLTTSLLALPFFSQLGLLPAMFNVALMMFSLEFGLVSLLAMATEIAPDARATLLSLLVTVFSISRIVAATVGGWLWRWENIALQAGAGALCALVGALVLAFGARKMTGEDATPPRHPSTGEEWP